MLLLVAWPNDLHFLILCLEGCFFFYTSLFFRHYFSLKFQQSFSVFPSSLYIVFINSILMAFGKREKISMPICGRCRQRGSS